MLTYLSSVVPLPMGRLITAPDMIYDNYAAYRNSSNYVEINPERIFVAPPYDFDKKLYNTNCRVYFYQINSKIHILSIYKYDKDYPPTRILPDMGQSEGPLEVQEQAVFDQDVSKHFSLPYIYYLGQSPNETALREYLCANLKSEEKAELYECWACTEREERDKTWDQTVDLQKFIDNGDLTIPKSKYAEEAKKRFVVYKAPLTSSILFNYIGKEDVIMIFADVWGQYEEHIPYSLAEKTLGKYCN